MNSLRERLQSASLTLLDGATGTELARRGVDVGLPLWSAQALQSAPDVLRTIHAEYVAAGADVLTACTFRTHERTLGDARRAAEWTRLAVTLARDAAEGRAFVVGSQAPLEDCYRPQLTPDEGSLRREHRQMSANLANAGVDGILVETMPTIREAVAAMEAASETALPVLVSFVCNASGRLLSGESLTEAFQAVRPLQPAAVLVNCLPAETVLKALAELHSVADLPCGAYANVGRFVDGVGWEDTAAVDPGVYAATAVAWRAAGAALIGGCCGTTPTHVRQLREMLSP